MNNRYINSLILLLLIRPHIGASLIVGYGISFANQIKKKKYLYLRITILIILSLTFWILIPFLQNFAGVNANNIIDGFYLLEERFSQTTVENVNSNYISRVIFFLFTPFPKISLNPLYLADYVNTVFITYYLFSILKDEKSYRNITSNPFFLFAIILLLLLPVITFNPGVATRQKWMFLPALIVSLKKNRYLNYEKLGS